MNGMDLSQFQFDYDQTWAAMFLRPDGTVIARYGTREARDGMTVNSLEGLRSTMASVLAVNRSWSPAKQQTYAAKRGPAAVFAMADEIPSTTISNILAREQQGKESCIHCHNVYDALRDVAIAKGDYDPNKRWKYPLPSNIGLAVDPATGTTITAVQAHSSAARAGLRVGDEIRALNAQPIHSIADIQFVLHHLDEVDELRISLEAEQPKIVQLESGWRVGDIGWRASMYGMPPRPGLWVQAASPEEKAELDVPADGLAMKVRGVFGEDVRRSGLQKDDFIIQFGDETSHHSEGDFHAKLRLNYFRPNSKLRLKLIRDGRKMDLVVTFPNEQVAQK